MRINTNYGEKEMGLIENIEKEKLIVILRAIAKEKLFPLVEAMYNGGVRLVEITYSANDKIADEDTAENIKMLVKQFDGRVCIGAGTVLTEKQVELTYKAGGKFIVSPDSSVEVIKKTKELGMVSIAGALTPTEIQTAHRLGADFVKLFPVSSLGADYVKAIKAPLSHVKLLAFGGIDDNNIRDYLLAGVSGFGVGSNIVNSKMIEENDWLGITELAKKTVSKIRSDD